MYRDLQLIQQGQIQEFIRNGGGLYTLIPFEDIGMDGKRCRCKPLGSHQMYIIFS